MPHDILQPKLAMPFSNYLTSVTLQAFEMGIITFCNVQCIILRNNNQNRPKLFNTVFFSRIYFILMKI